MANTTRPAHELLGMPVFSATEGKRVGEVSTLLVSQPDRALAAMEVSSGLLAHRRFLPFAEIQTIGTDAVMVETEAALATRRPASETQRLDAHLSGRPVLTESGERLGEIADFQVNVATGKIEAFLLRCDTGIVGRLKALVRNTMVEIPDTSVVSLGDHALIVRNEVASADAPEAAEVAGAT